ncbi:MAG: exo-alpha-sialidase [Proteobacteria bacterium]|nr:exo-alpha-sialidase [Pseudomonadota bacterium]
MQPSRRGDHPLLNLALSLAGSAVLLSGCGSSASNTYFTPISTASISSTSTPSTRTPLKITVKFPVGKTSSQVPLDDQAKVFFVHVEDPETLDDLQDPIELQGNGDVTQTFTVEVDKKKERIRVACYNEDGEEVASGSDEVDESAAKTASASGDGVTVNVNTPVYNDQGTFVSFGPGPLFDNTGEQQQDVSGRMPAVLTDPSNSAVMYGGTASSGVWKTTDGGNTWTPLTDNQPTLATGALALDPNDNTNSTLYVGTGESNSNGFYGAGLLRSTDGGASFSLLPGSSVFARKAVSRVWVKPGAPNTILAGVFPVTGSNFGGSYIADDGNTGPFISTDGGQTFANAFQTSFGANPSRPCTDIVARPDDANWIFAAVDASGGTPANSGIYRSTDGGATWTQLSIKDSSNNVLVAPTQLSRIRLATAMSNSTPVLYALVGNEQGRDFRGLFATQDNGATWVEVKTSPTIPSLLGQQSNYDSCIAVDPINPLVVYLGGVGPIRVDGINLANGNATVVPIGPGSRSTSTQPHVDYQYFEAINVGGKTTLRATTDGGLYQLVDAAAATATTPWGNLNGNQATGRIESLQLYGLALNPRNAKQAWTGMQDNGSAYFDDNRRWTEVQGGDGTLARVDPVNPDIVYYASQYGANFLSRYTGGGKEASKATNITKGINTADPGEFVTPYVVHPTTPTRLAVGTNQVYETDNRGDTWSVTSGGPLDGTVTITALAYHPKSTGVLYAGLNNGKVFCRLSEGGQFTGKAVVTGFRISALAVDIDDATGKTAYATVPQFNPNGGKLFKTTDGGQTWADVSAGLPDSPAQSVYIDNSVAPNRIFVGTDTAGLFSREKTGTSFTAFGKGLPSVQITGIERAGLVLAIATYGKGMYQIPLTVEEKVAAPVVVGNAPSGPSARARANARSAR